MQIEQGANLPRVKVTNQSAILRMIYYFGPIKRADIAKSLELTLPTITTNVNNMMAAGIVREVGMSPEDTAGFGRKARLLEVVPASRHFIGIEMTGSRRAISIVDYRGCEIQSYHDTDSCQDYMENMGKISEMIKKCLKELKLTFDQIDGVCFGLPGVVDREAGILKIHPRNQWHNKNIRDDFRAMTGYTGEILVENNSCIRALGAQVYQREILKNTQSYTYLFVDTGIACPLIVDSSNYTGSVVGAGEVGHMVMEANGRECSCGNHGCLEAYCSDRAIIGQCAEAMEQGKTPILQTICKDNSQLSIPLILEAGRRGDKEVNCIVDQAIYTLGVAAANIINFTSPDTMVIECKLFQEEKNRKLLVDTAKENLCNKTYRGTEFVFVKPDLASGSKGAAAVAINANIG